MYSSGAVRRYSTADRCPWALIRSGHQRLALQLDAGRPVGDADRGGRADLGDLAVADDDRALLDDLAGAVDHPAVDEGGDLRLGGEAESEHNQRGDECSACHGGDSSSVLTTVAARRASGARPLHQRLGAGAPGAGGGRAAPRRHPGAVVVDRGRREAAAAPRSAALSSGSGRSPTRYGRAWPPRRPPARRQGVESRHDRAALPRTFHRPDARGTHRPRLRGTADPRSGGYRRGPARHDPRWW